MSAARLTRAVPVLPVREIAPAVAYYAERLGFAADYADDGYAVLTRDAVAIHLWAAADERWKGRDGDRPVVSGAESFLAGTASCRIGVTGIDALCTACAAAGVIHPNGAPGDRPWGTREFAVLDLDGNLITFVEPQPAEEA